MKLRVVKATIYLLCFSAAISSIKGQGTQTLADDSALAERNSSKQAQKRWFPWQGQDFPAAVNQGAKEGKSATLNSSGLTVIPPEPLEPATPIEIEPSFEPKDIDLPLLPPQDLPPELIGIVRENPEYLYARFGIGGEGPGQYIICDEQTGAALAPSFHLKDADKYLNKRVKITGTVHSGVETLRQWLMVSSIDLTGDLLREVIYNFSPGWNLIALPFYNPDYTARNFLDEINRQGAGAMKVARFDPQVSIFEDTPDKAIILADDYNLLPSEAYFVYCQSESSPKIYGKPLSKPVPIKLSKGWNAFGVPSGYNSFLQLAERINKQGGFVERAVQWDATTQSWVDLNSFYTLDDTQGCFLYNESGSLFIPQVEDPPPGSSSSIPLEYTPPSARVEKEWYWLNLVAVPGWPQAVQDYSPSIGRNVLKSSPLAADIDADGYQEVIYCSSYANDGTIIYAFRHDGAPIAGWPVEIAGEMFKHAQLAVGDFDLNYPGLEIIGGSEKGGIFVYHNDGSLMDGWPKYPDNARRLSPVLAEIDGDKQLELIVGSYETNGLFYCYKADGTLLAGWPIQINSLVSRFATPSAADINKDGLSEIIIPTQDGHLHALDKTGRDISGWPVYVGNDVLLGAACGDIDGDGSIEIAASSQAAKLYVYNYDGSIKSGWPQDMKTWAYLPYKDSEIGRVVPSSGRGQPVLADLDGDGKMEIICTAYAINLNPSYMAGLLYAYRYNGLHMDNFPLFLYDTAPLQVCVVDVNRDSWQEILYCQYDGEVNASYPNGKREYYKGFPIGLMYGESFAEYVDSTPCVSDINRDGLLEIIYAAKGKLYARFLSANATETSASWPQYNNNPRNTVSAQPSRNEQLQFQFRAGWNAASFPFIKYNYRASELFKDIQSQGGIPLELAVYNRLQGRFVPADSLDNLWIIPQEGYFLRCGRDSALTIFGETISRPLPMLLKENTGCLGFPHFAGTSLDLKNESGQQGGEITGFSYWDPAYQQWQSLEPGSSRAPIIIEEDKAYLITCGRNSMYIPREKSAKGTVIFPLRPEQGRDKSRPMSGLDKSSLYPSSSNK